MKPIAPDSLGSTGASNLRRPYAVLFAAPCALFARTAVPFIFGDHPVRGITSPRKDSYGDTTVPAHQGLQARPHIEGAQQLAVGKNVSVS
jgi:hypothetical protein